LPEIQKEGGAQTAPNRIETEEDDERNRNENRFPIFSAPREEAPQGVLVIAAYVAYTRL